MVCLSTRAMGVHGPWVGSTRLQSARTYIGAPVATPSLFAADSIACPFETDTRNKNNREALFSFSHISQPPYIMCRLYCTALYCRACLYLTQHAPIRRLNTNSIMLCNVLV